MTGNPRRWIASFLTGVLFSAIPLGLYVELHRHHYSEMGTFYQGAVADRKVVGIAYVEFDGWGFMALTHWKVRLVSRSGEHMTLYQKSSVFQEKIPHQPKIEINGHHIHIDDGEDQIDVEVQQKL